MDRLISVITISYNSQETIGRTIESVLRQGFHSIEYIIIDGNSSDATVSIAESYRERMEAQGIRYRIYSEPDAGIYDAMNKGIRLAEGDIIGILNSGDWYEDNTVKTVTKVFDKKQCDLVFGNIRLHRVKGGTLIKKARIRKFQTSRDWNHPTMFVRAELYKKNPFLCKGVHDDYGFYLKMVKQDVKITILDRVLANFEMGGISNNKSLKSAKKRIMDRYQWCYRINGYSRWYMLECILTETAKMILG